MGKRITDRPSALKLSELYHGAEKPSMGMLATRLGVARSTVHTWLKEARITVRSVSEQKSIDINKGRVKSPIQYCGMEARRRIGHTNGACQSPESRAAFLKAGQSPQARRKTAEKLKKPTTRPCYWCSVLVTRLGTQASRRERFFCSRSHWGQGIAFIRLGRDKTQPRPLILALFIERMADLRKQGLPIGAATMQKAAEPIGAGGIELEAYLGTLTPREMDEYLDNQLEHDVRAAGL